jgi:hypothetical protein
MSVMKGFIAAVAFVLLAFLALGFALDGTWRVTRTAEIGAPAAAVFPYVNDVRGWNAWVPWDHVEDTLYGPEAGVGAGRRWNDAHWGQGNWTLTESDPPIRVAYEVRVEGGSQVTRGEVVLERGAAGGTRVSWTESGDFGWNPFLAYMALGMDRMQGREMDKNLAALKALVEGGGS